MVNNQYWLIINWIRQKFPNFTSEKPGTERKYWVHVNNYTVGFSLKNTKYSRLPIIRTFKGNRKKFESSRVKLYRNKSLGNVLKGNENCFELGGGSRHRGFELLGVDCK